MIPILYEKTETAFTNNGLGRLSDCIRCIVTEERNGIFECEFDYPVSGPMFGQIEEGRIIGCTHDEQGDVQPFDIYGRSEPINGVVTFYAHHISYRLNEITVKPFTAGSCAEALTKIGTESVNANPFTFWTNKSVTAAFNSDVPKNAKDMLSGSQGSILDIYGTGEYKYDKFNVNLYLHRGQDTNVSIRYGKNLIDYTNSYDVSDSYTAVVPYWLGDETQGEQTITTLVMLPELFLSSGHTVPSGREVVIPMDLSSDFNKVPTVAQLRATATTKLARSDGWLPNQTVKVNFVQLWQTEEYAEYAVLQRLNLCDTCGIFVPMYGTSLRAKVIRTVYNVLLDRYDEMELGDKPTAYSAVLEKMYGNQIADVEAGLRAVNVDIGTVQNIAAAYTDNQIAAAKTTIEGEYEQAIEDATEQIRGGMGGYIVTTVNANGQPIELLITDNLNLNQAVNIWRWNLGGLAHSHNGYNGPFNDVAITQDGKINATMITAGTLTANLIKAGVLQDANGYNSWNLATGVLSMAKGSITLGNGNFEATDTGKITAKGGGVIRDTPNKNSWNLDSGQFKTEQGQIGPFIIASTGLTYTGQTSKTVIDNNGIATLSRASIGSDHIVGGAAIKSATIKFTYAADGNYDVDSATVASRIALVRTTIPSINYGIAFFSQSNTLQLGLYDDGATYPVDFTGDTRIKGNFVVASGYTKSREVETDNYGKRLQYSYETPVPMFGDIGEVIIDEDGLGYVDIDDIFSETIADRVEYQVFLQKEGEGDCWISEKAPRYFVVQGTPGLKVAWELKAKQKEFINTRLEPSENYLDEYEYRNNNDDLLMNYITEQEALLYG